MHIKEKAWKKPDVSIHIHVQLHGTTSLVAILSSLLPVKLLSKHQIKMVGHLKMLFEIWLIVAVEKQLQQCLPIYSIL